MEGSTTRRLRRRWWPSVSFSILILALDAPRLGARGLLPRFPFPLSPQRVLGLAPSDSSVHSSGSPSPGAGPSDWLHQLDSRWRDRHVRLAGGAPRAQETVPPPARNSSWASFSKASPPPLQKGSVSRGGTSTDKRRFKKRVKYGPALMFGGRRVRLLPPLHYQKNLTFYGHMLAGAVARSCAQTSMHPANVIKTIIQTNGRLERQHLTWPVLTRGAGAQFILSVPHGAMSFALVEGVKKNLVNILPHLKFAGPVFDFVSSAISTTLCSAISTPQMVMTDRIMAGYYPNLLVGVRSLIQRDGVKGFYAGWAAALTQKIPSYGLTWVFFQQLKIARIKFFGEREATNAENIFMGSMAAAATVTILIPLDTIKTRIVTQAVSTHTRVPYKGIADCFLRVVREEGIRTFYRPLLPRLVSVVPMIGIQFAVYEGLKRAIRALPEYDDESSPSRPSFSMLEDMDDLTIEEGLYDEAEA